MQMLPGVIGRHLWEYVAALNGFAPLFLITILAWAATIFEVIIAIGLLIGWHLRWFALSAGILLLLFAITMTLAFGIKVPLDYSVYSASAGAFLLAAINTEELIHRYGYAGL